MAWNGTVQFKNKLQDPTLINTRRVNTLLYSVHVYQWVLCCEIYSSVADSKYS